MYEYLYYFNFSISDECKGSLGFILELEEHSPDNVSIDILQKGIHTRLAEIATSDIDIYEAFNLVDDNDTEIEEIDLSKTEIIDCVISSAENYAANNTLLDSVDFSYFAEAREFLYS